MQVRDVKEGFSSSKGSWCERGGGEKKDSRCTLKTGYGYSRILMAVLSITRHILNQVYRSFFVLSSSSFQKWDLFVFSEF